MAVTSEGHGDIDIQEQQSLEHESKNEASPVAATSDQQDSRKCVLKDIFIECSSPHQFSDELTLAVRRRESRDAYAPVDLLRISPTKWKAVSNAELCIDYDGSYIILVIRSENENARDAAFIKLTADDVYNIACAEEDTPVELIPSMNVVNTNNSKIKLIATVGTLNAGTDTAQLAWQKAIHYQTLFDETGNVDNISQAIFYYNKTISLDPPDHIVTMVFYFLGNAYSSRFETTGNLQDADSAISYHQKGVDSTPPGHVDLPKKVNNLANAYLERFKRTGNPQDIDYAIIYYQKVVDSTPIDDDEIIPYINNLGYSYIYRFERTGNVQDIDFAISYHQKAVDLAPTGHMDLPGWLNDLATSHMLRFKRTGDLHNIDSVISRRQRVVDITSPGHTDLVPYLNSLGSSYFCRFERTGDLQDIDHAIYYHQKAADTIPMGHSTLPMLVNNLGNSYLRRFETVGNHKDVDCAISCHQKAVDLSIDGHADLPSWLSNLGYSYSRRFERTRDLQDINYAISQQHKAIDTTPRGHVSLPGGLSKLAISYSLRFKQTGDIQDIDYAIVHHQKAVDATSPNHADLVPYLSNLGSSYVHRFERTGNLEDIDHAISYHQRAADSTPIDHTNLSIRLINLGSSYLQRYRRTGVLQDINHAIAHHKKAVESAPPGRAYYSGHLNSLGVSYSLRFRHTGDLQDIDYAITHHLKAIELTPPGHTSLLGLHQELGNSYLSRFERTNDMQDIHFSISYLRKAVEAAPTGHIGLPGYVSNLGSAYMRRFDFTGDLHDIEHAISYYQKGVDLTPPDHSDLPNHFNHLGASYSRRFKRTGDPHDIDYSISHHQRAMHLTPPDHNGLWGCLHGLGTSYLLRFGRTGDLQDINRALSHIQKSLELSPLDHVFLPALLNDLGYLYQQRFKITNNPTDVTESIASYRRGAAANGRPSTRLLSAKNASILSSLHDRSRCLGDITTAINLLAEVAGLEQTIHRRYANLQGHTEFVRFSVATALELDRSDLALEWLEQGRCLVWNQLNQLRTPVDDLSIVNPSLADRFTKIASALQSYGSRPTPSRYTTTTSLADEIRYQSDSEHHTVYTAQYKQLVEEIRTLPDFHDFLRPPQAIDILHSIPTTGPIVVFNLYETRCDALALVAGHKRPILIPLKNFNLEQAIQLQRTLRLDLVKQREVVDRNRVMPRRVELNPTSMVYVLGELWIKVVYPILDALGFSSHPTLSGRRRIWWCPTGPLAFMPLHAAGVYGSRPGVCVSDFAVSSYTPSVTSLKYRATSASSRSEPTNLLLINPNTPGLPALPFARLETRDLKSLLGESALLLEEAAVTTDAVKREMNTHSWVHFACHGIQDSEDPLKSAIHLYDGRLELLEIIRQKFSNPDFAFLSACQTSKGDLKLSDEVVHLAAGMLAAGYSGVVGTMWSISDPYGPEFAKHFYEYLLENKGPEPGLDSTQAAHALDHATRQVRESLGEGDVAFLTWVPYVHVGY